MSISRSRALPLLALALALALGGASQAAPQASPKPKGLKYSISIDPPRPAVGSRIVLELLVEGIAPSASRVAELRLGSALVLESESIRPVVIGSSRGAAFRFELRLLDSGERRLETLVIDSPEGSLRLDSIAVGEPGPAAAQGGPAPAWRWVVPAEALRYEAFGALLEASDGSAAPPGLAPSFVPPAGASFERSGPLSWTVIAFDEGSLDLPGLRLGEGRGAGEALPAKVAIEALPPPIASTRAIGSFALSLKRLPGAALRFALVLEGRGNLPAVLLPEPVVSLGGTALPRGEAPRLAWTSSRFDDARAAQGSYEGTASLIVEVFPPRPGLLSIGFPPLAVFDPKSGPSTLEVQALELKAAQSAPAKALRPLGGGKALAELYGALRRAPPLSSATRAARKAALARAAELGTGPPLMDALPPPGFFAWPAFALTLGFLCLFILRKRDARILLSLVALSMILGSLGLASASERRAKYAVVWADELRAVPSSASVLRAAVIRGSTARARGASGDYVSVVLSDGAEGWALRDSLFWY